ncbi:MAG: hypothetical protein M0Z85_12210 [Gammaproteobacteria bacterium]|nr:hypothetical protein [Gammaproteobacteria bacterium]
MTPISQTRFEKNGQNGNCMQAATASMLDLPLRLVPNFIESKDANKHMDEFFEAMGYRVVERPKDAVPRGFYFVTGTSTQGHQHIVIYRNGVLVHDPNPNGRGLVKIDKVLEVVPRKRRHAHDAMPQTILRAVHPSAALEAWYRKKLEDMVHEMARSMLWHMRAAWKKADPDIGFAADEAPTVTLRKALEKWGVAAIRKFEKAAEEISKGFAGRAMRDFDSRFQRILRAAGFTVKFAPTRAMTEAYRSVIAQQVGLIKSIPQKFLTDVQTSVWQSVMKGSDMSGLEKAIKHNYGVTWRRAGLIARDQTHKARAFFEEARRAELGITEAIWVHSGGGHEPRPEHVKWGREKKRYDIKKGMWSSVDQAFVWPGTAINCFPSDSLIHLANDVRVAYRRWYCGKLAVISTDSGKTIRATPNHPIFTPHGWVTIKSLREGDYVWEIPDESVGCQGFSASLPGLCKSHIKQAVPSIGEIFRSLRSAVNTSVAHKTLGEDFHGDAIADSNVDIVFSASPLSFGRQSGVLQSRKKFQLPHSYNAGLRSSFSEQFITGRFLASSRLICGSHESLSVLDRSSFHALEHGGTSIPHAAASKFDSGNYRGASDSVFPGEFQNGKSAFMLPANLTRLSKIVFEEFEGHVYNLETASHWYIADGIIAHNCRCISRSVFTGMTDVT